MSEKSDELNEDGLPKCWISVGAPFVRRMKKAQQQRMQTKQSSIRSNVTELYDAKVACLMPVDPTLRADSVADKEVGSRPVSAVSVALSGTAKPARDKFPIRAFYSTKAPRRPNSSANPNRPVRVNVPNEFWDEFTNDFAFHKRASPKADPPPPAASENTSPVRVARPQTGKRVQFSGDLTLPVPVHVPVPVPRVPSAVSNSSARSSARDSAAAAAYKGQRKQARCPSSYLETVQDKFAHIYRRAGATGHNNDLVLLVPNNYESINRPTSAASSFSRVSVVSRSDVAHDDPKHSFVHVPLSSDERSTMNSLLQSPFLRQVRPLTMHRRPKSSLKQDVEYFSFWKGSQNNDEFDYY